MTAEKMTLVTGATGLVGFNIVEELLEANRPVRVLVRSAEKARALLSERVDIVEGDLTRPDSLSVAFDRVDRVFHAAGIPEQWLRDKTQFHKVNVDGTQAIIEAALDAGVTRLVYTSTIDVFEAASGQAYNESVIDTAPKGTVYERSKQEADRLVVAAITDHDLPAVFVHPAAVYGPGPTDSPSLNDLAIKLSKDQAPLLLPGGMPLVYSKDVGKGHLLAEEKGAIGERFILSDAYYSLVEIASAMLTEIGREKTPPMMPVWIGKLIANLGEVVASVTGKPPLIPKGQLHFLSWGATPINTRAREKLGMDFVTLDEGIRETITRLRHESRIPV